MNMFKITSDAFMVLVKLGDRFATVLVIFGLFVKFRCKPYTSGIVLCEILVKGRGIEQYSVYQYLWYFSPTVGH